jgi:vitamin B12 transporter
MNCSSTRAGIAALTPLALVSALSILIITPAAAQSASDKTLAPVVVTASRIEQPQTDALPHTTVITSDDIRNSPTFDLPSLLRREAGIQVTQNGGPGQSSSLFMRGAAPAQTLVLIDGVPVRRQGFSAQPALEHILPEQIDRIEIVRGNVSAIYGSGAIGGVVQIFTKQGAGQPAVSFSAEAGSHGTRTASGSVSGKSGDTRYALSATRFRTDGFSANNVAQFPTENPDKDGYRNNSVAGSVSNEWAKGHEIGARLYANDGKFDFDGGGFGGPTDTGGGTSKQQSFAVFSKNRFAPNWLSTVTLSQTETRNDNTYLTVFGTFREKGDTKLFQWANEVALSSNWTLVAGLDAGREELDAFSNDGFSGPKNNSFDRSTSSVYAGVNGKLDAHQFQANIRRDRVGGAGSDSTGYLGYGFALTPNVKLIASASTAFNAPTLTQFFDPMSGNPNLKAEKSRSYEVGAQYAAGATLLRATLFKTRTNNQFGIDPNNCFRGANPTSCPTFNIAKGSNEGLELSANTQVASVDLRASLTLQDPKDDTTNKRLIRRAKTMASLSMSKAFGAMRVGTDLQYTGSRPDVNFLTGAAVEHGSYWLANLSARYQVSKNVSLLGRVDNVFDRNYQTTYGYNQPPRGVFAGVNWQM